MGAAGIDLVRIQGAPSARKAIESWLSSAGKIAPDWRRMWPVLAYVLLDDYQTVDAGMITARFQSIS